MLGRRLRLLCLGGLLVALQFAPGRASAAAPEPYDPWPGLVQDIFDNHAMEDGAGVIAIEMPYRAEDAAIVPVTLRTMLPAGDSRRVVAITLVIDQNPSPMAARFELGQDSSVSQISTRVRVNNYTDVHAVAELSDGKLYVAKTYVKASGGCSAPAAKNADEAKGKLGQMRFRQFTKSNEGPASGAREAQIMVGHAALCSGFFRQRIAGIAGRQTDPENGGRNFNLGGSEYSLHLCPERRQARPCRGQGYRGPRLPERMEGRRFRDLTWCTRSTAPRLPPARGAGR
jgi:quinoprotein dehydrogenase-associated SoxYZ-like carrier